MIFEALGADLKHAALATFMLSFSLVRFPKN
jgi:hypothetical protein